MFNSGLLKYSGKYKYLTVLSCVLSILSAAMSIVPLVCIYQIIRLYVENLSTKSIMHYGEIAVISSVLGIALYFVALSLAHISAFRVAKNLKSQAINKVIDMPLGFFEMRSTGEIRKIIDENTILTEDFLAHKLPDFAATAIMPLIIVISFFFFDWRLGVVCFIPLIISVICIKIMMGGENKFMMGKIMTLQEQMNKEAVEYVRGIPIIKVFQQTVFSFKKFHNTIMSYRDLVAGYAKACRMHKTIFGVMLNSFFVFLIAVAVVLFNSASDPIAVFLNLIFFILLSPLISTTMMRLMMTGENLIQAKEALNRIETIICDGSYIENGSDEFPENTEIVFSDVCFSYPEQEKNVIEHVSFEISKNQKVAFVGLSGSGKSTILSLIGKFFKVNSGTITIGSKNINEIRNSELMKNISFVFQDSKLFNGTLLENIRVGNPNASLEEVDKAITVAQCQSIIDKLPNGINSIYGSKGIFLSGGERQRIALARAFVKDSPIIVFDEATSGCDAENEFYINKAITEISKNKTVILVAHRLNTVIDADKIIVMEKGKIVEQGTHNDLVENNGAYANMWKQYQGASDWRL
ncbi:ABC transporter ATP-binding protein/permease [Peptostreptococcus anaerobius]|uniref:ABC transporter ATP-binding protein n=1 Tax=Peptostreptococcus anaerobius TaxID=1261 RepID=UPI001D06FD3B|nr:ABC transporter ATP-binding protein [Peptostreptococcus anaerobius]MCB6983750.1 ABC transporter ATP-binding protein/permease [Peptostreptococcus anaerobius]MCQ5151614.1 ABC transporter ATP-binding protein/permease [Peptostreptococcus anaerobius]